MPETKSIPDYLIIGHVCHDRVNGQPILGGTASYAGLVASSMGKKSGILTSTGADFLFESLLQQKNIDLKITNAPHTTVFENVYNGEQRTQYIRQRAATLYPADLPGPWKAVPIVQFSPIADEIDFKMLRLFSKALRVATIQGWLRKWDSTGKISQKEMPWEVLRFIDVVIFSEEDIDACPDAIEQIRNFSSTAIMTQGKHGAIVFQKNIHRHFPSFPTIPVDPTGAGDMFATAFTIKYAETGNLSISVAFAHAAASLIIEGVGIQSFPSIAQVNDRFGKYWKLFPAK